MPRLRRSYGLLTNYFARILIVTYSQQPRVTKLVVVGPLDEADLDDYLWLDPMGAQAREADGFGERRLFDFDLIELASQVEEQVSIKAGADLAGEDEVG